MPLRPVFAWGPALGVFLLGAAAGGVFSQAKPGSPADPGQVASPSGKPGAASPVSASVKTDKKTYASKDPIKITLEIKNVTPQPVKLIFGTSQRYDLVLQRGKGAKAEKVWQWSRGRMFMEHIVNVSLPPTKPLTFTETYASAEKGAGADNQPPLTAGDYTLTATVTTFGAAPRPTAVTNFKVK